MVYNYSRLLYRDWADCQEERPAEAFMSDSLVLLVNWGSNPFPRTKRDDQSLNSLARANVYYAARVFTVVNSIFRKIV